MTEAEYFQTEEGELMEFIEMCEGQQIWLSVLNHLTRLHRLRDKGLHERLRGLVYSRSYDRELSVVWGTILLGLLADMQ